MYLAAFAARSTLLNATNVFHRVTFLNSSVHKTGKLTCTRNHGKIARPLDLRVKQVKKRTSDSEDESFIGIYGYLLLSVPIGTFLLGYWQVQRRKQKLELIEKLETRTTMEPRELPQNFQELESMEYCKVKVRGKFLHEKEFTFGPKSLIIDGAGAGEGSGGILSTSQGTTGFNIITPFKLEDRDVTIMVNRGWVPTKFKDPSTRLLGQVADTVELIGVVRLNESRPQFLPQNKPEKGVWFYKDLEAMAEASGSDPVYIELTTANHLPGTPVGGQTRVSLRNEHMSYIITWYSLSAMTGYIWFRKFLMKL